MSHGLGRTILLSWFFVAGGHAYEVAATTRERIATREAHSRTRGVVAAGRNRSPGSRRRSPSTLRCQRSRSRPPLVVTGGFG
jgi:hypothetical protein